ncbi:MAG TPA: cyanophycin synthetase, partial [Ktedonobacterales bacterium]|nr:cyanophycin synthetase [Ktedonobacterales bacterium]
SAYFINEADEFNYNFASYHPRMALLTEVEYDHPEFFASYEAIRDAFVGFLRGMDTSPVNDATNLPPTLILNGDSPGCRDTLSQLEAQIGPWPGAIRTFRVEGESGADLFGRPADALATDIEDAAHTSFTLHVRGQRLGRVTIQTPGRHYVANAVAAVAGADALGVAPETLIPALSAFGGLKRRFEVIQDGDVTFIDDYAHHPHAVALTLATARRRFPGRRLIGVFQPTLYTRLHRFLTPFAEALATSDLAVVVEIQPSRERDTGLIHGDDLVRAIVEQPGWGDKSAYYGGDFAQTAALLNKLRQPGDVIAVMGSGPVNQVISLAMER